MKTILIWILISVSDAAYNRGNVDVIEKFDTAQDCEYTKSFIPKEGNKVMCVPAKVVVKEENK